MRIAFLGKGGSGKTTTAAGFARYLADRFPFVLALDADVNAHFKTALGLSGDPVHLEGHFDEVIEYLRGKRADLGERPMLATTPPALDSNFIAVSPADELLRRYALVDGSLALLTVGQYKQADMGGSCYHTKLFGLAAILHHMLDGETDFVVADTTAGTDNLATSLWFAYDMNVFVVEPTAKSVSVYRDFIGVSPELAEKTYVVGNKVEGEEDEEFIRESVAEGRYLGSVPLSRHLKRFEQGKEGALEEFRKEQQAPFQAVLEALCSRKRDWPAYLSRLRDAHGKVCRDWFNDFHGIALDADLDPEFSYEAAVAARQSPVLSPTAAGSSPAAATTGTDAGENETSCASQADAPDSLIVTTGEAPAVETALAANIPTSSQQQEAPASAPATATANDGAADNIKS